MSEITFCGYNPTEPSGQTLEEMLKQCAGCVKLSICDFARQISTKAVKEAFDEPPRSLKDAARKSINFEQFHNKQETDTQNDPLEGLPYLALKSQSFEEFRKQARQNDSKNKDA